MPIALRTSPISISLAFYLLIPSPSLPKLRRLDFHGLFWWYDFPPRCILILCQNVIVSAVPANSADFTERWRTSFSTVFYFLSLCSAYSVIGVCVWNGTWMNKEGGTTWCNRWRQELEAVQTRRCNHIQHLQPFWFLPSYLMSEMLHYWAFIGRSSCLEERFGREIVTGLAKRLIRLGGLPCKSDDLSLTPRTHIKVKGENRIRRIVLQSSHMYHNTCALPH